MTKKDAENLARAFEDYGSIITGVPLQRRVGRRPALLIFIVALSATLGAFTYSAWLSSHPCHFAKGGQIIWPVPIGDQNRREGNHKTVYCREDGTAYTGIFYYNGEK